MITTIDRGDVIHFAGRHHLSPALRDGVPVLAGHGDPAGRCGWATFFAELGGRGLAARLDPEDGGSFAAVPRTEAGAAHAARRPPVAEARRFVEALRGRFSPGG
ncbi:hypothetical protein [Anaeromyxobacter oryzae]|uniref:Uncharacterized protein n=1 Tax=Anaeromyxobacter oryzae TaxID=2918170 RepID=A0ABM7WQD2_9BACT|nr:hypothetical protein [Anaeromyxobacter oryzae]BDG01671.1 hypothetical protein AMOR_06670 [Anaeromyxobacter oryzae]